MGRGISWKYLKDRLFKIICLILYTIFWVSRNVGNRIKGSSVAPLSPPYITNSAKVILAAYLLLAVVQPPRSIFATKVLHLLYVSANRRSSDCLCGS